MSSSFEQREPRLARRTFPFAGRPPRGTVRAKLMRIVMLTTGLAVLIAGLAMLTQDFSVYRKSWAENLTNDAEILALSIAPALEFDDFEVAERDLSALQARPQVQVAALYSAHGNLYATYKRPGARAPPAHAPPEGLRMMGDEVELARPVERKGELLGFLYLRARYNVWSRLATYFGIFSLVTLLSVSFAYLVSTRLQEGITEPLDSMASVAREVASRRDYSLRARKRSDDEIGVVVDAFNNMLEEVETRSRALEEEVAVRKSTEAALSVATARLESTMAAAEIGSWQWDVRTNEFTADRNLAAMYGLGEGALNGDPSLHHRYIHPDDLAQVLEAEDKAVRTGLLPATEFRIRLPGDVEKSMARRGRVQFDTGGRVIVVSGLLIDITPQKRAERALREADRRKDEFLATLAHELRNPLAPIRHAVRLLESKGVSERQQQWARNVISRQVQRMALLLDDLLDVSRITRGRLNLKLDRVSVESVVEAAVETARPLIDAKHHQLTVEIPPMPIMVNVDPLRISQSLSNLLTNAAKYTDAHGHIGIKVTREPGGLVMAVRDNGIGFEPVAAANMFEMFSQLDSPIDRTEGGLGIGLSLVKGLITLHGGTVEAHSPGLGFGSEFIIRLPPSVISEKSEPVKPESPSVALNGEAHLKVLVADDNRDAAESLGMLLEINGHEVLVASSGHQALHVARESRPQAIILDIGMPDMTGYDVAREIRKEPWGAGVLLLAVTGWGQREDKDRAKEAGFDHHLTKPVDVDRVEQLLRTCHARTPVA